MRWTWPLNSRTDTTRCGKTSAILCALAASEFLLTYLPPQQNHINAC